MTAVLAAYGAVIGTIGALGAGWAIWNGLFRDRARVRTEVATGFLQNVRGAPNDGWVWFITVMNRGRRPLSVSGYAGPQLAKEGLWKFGKRSKWILFSNCFEALPGTVGEGQKLTYWRAEGALAKSLREEGLPPIRVLVKDDAGHQYSRRIKGKYLRQMKELSEGQRAAPVPSPNEQ